MVLRIFASLIVFLIVSVANATTYKIRHIMVDQSGVIAETSNPNEVLKPGQVFVATFPGGKQCSVTLKQQIGAVLMVDTSGCKYWREITKETPLDGPSRAESTASAPKPTPAPAEVVEKSAVESASAATQAPAQASAPVAKKQEGEVAKPRSAFRRLALSIHYSFANEMHFKDGITASGASASEVTMKTDQAFGLGLSLAEMPPQGWGTMGNFFYETQRNITSPASTGATPKISFLVAEGCLVHRWNSFYMPFGLNYSLPLASDVGGSSISNGKGLGIVVGTGLLINERSSVEFFLRALAMRLTDVSGATTTTYDNGSMSGFGVGYKYWF